MQNSRIAPKGFEVEMLLKLVDEDILQSLLGFDLWIVHKARNNRKTHWGLKRCNQCLGCIASEMGHLGR